MKVEFLTFFKNTIKKILLSIPFGIIIFKILSFFYNLPNKFREIKIYRKIYIKNQASKLLNKLKNSKSKNVLLVYDCKISPGTIGDFIRFVMLGRFFLAMNFKVTFIIITGEYRESWNRHSSEYKVKRHLNTIKQIANQLLPKKANVQRMSFDKFDKLNYINNKDYFVLFPKRVKNRIQIYREAFHLLNYLVYFSNTKKINDILLNKDVLHKNIDDKRLPKKYITLHCRKEKKRRYWARNLEKNDFIKIIKILKNNFSNYKIIIISDKYGCQFFKKVSKKNKFNCLFSKDFSSTILGDGYIILNSDFYFQLFGGGVDCFPLYSKIPCLVNQRWANNEVYLSKVRTSIWQTKKQFFSVNMKNKIFFNKLKQINSKQLNV